MEKFGIVTTNLVWWCPVIMTPRSQQRLMSEVKKQPRSKVLEGVPQHPLVVRDGTVCYTVPNFMVTFHLYIHVYSAPAKCQTLYISNFNKISLTDVC